MAGLELLPCPSGPQSCPLLATWGGCTTPPRQFLLEAAKVPWTSQTTPKPRGAGQAYILLPTGERALLESLQHSADLMELKSPMLLLSRGREHHKTLAGDSW